MNENENIVKDEESKTTEQVNEESVAQAGTRSKKNNVLSKISGILYGIVIALAGVLIVFGFIHLGFVESRAIREFVCSVVCAILGSALYLISSSKNRTMRKNIISIIVTVVSIIVLLIFIISGVELGFRDIYKYRDEEHMTSNLYAIYEYNGNNYLIDDYTVYKYNHYVVFGYEGLSNEEIIEKYKDIDELSLVEFLSRQTEDVTVFTDIKYDYKNATMTFEEGTVFVDYSGDMYLNGNRLAKYYSWLDFDDIMEELQNCYSYALSENEKSRYNTRSIEGAWIINKIIDPGSGADMTDVAPYPYYAGFAFNDGIAAVSIVYGYNNTQTVNCNYTYNKMVGDYPSYRITDNENNIDLIYVPENEMILFSTNDYTYFYTVWFE